MAIYQAPRKRWRLGLVCAVIGALAGVALGFALGGENDDPRAAMRMLDAKLEDAAAPLDVLVIHGRADTGSSTDTRVVIDAVARTTERFDEVRDIVRTINPDAVEDFDDHTAKLRELARERGDAEEIADEADELADLLRDIVRT